jgi:hypothetical protein
LSQHITLTPRQAGARKHLTMDPPTSSKKEKSVPSNGWALAASGRGERTPFYRNQLQATQTARKRADSHLSAARRVRRSALTEPASSIQKRHSAVQPGRQLDLPKHWLNSHKALSMTLSPAKMQQSARAKPTSSTNETDKPKTLLITPHSHHSRRTHGSTSRFIHRLPVKKKKKRFV